MKKNKQTKQTNNINKPSGTKNKKNLPFVDHLGKKKSNLITVEQSERNKDKPHKVKSCLTEVKIKQNVLRQYEWQWRGIVWRGSKLEYPEKKTPTTSVKIGISNYHIIRGEQSAAPTRDRTSTLWTWDNGLLCQNTPALTCWATGCRSIGFCQGFHYSYRNTWWKNICGNIDE